MSAEKPGFLPHIQALRALAVILVVVYHLWPERLPGGFIGVDVFFVISGFLITSHLQREAEARGTVSLPGFYARRARRLLPAALTVLVVTAVAILIWMPVTRWAVTFRELAASAFYVENWALVARSANYLALEAAPSPFQHYWSLSVEEQFYLVWPLLIVIAGAVAARAALRRSRVTFAVLVVVVVASLAYAQFITVADPGTAYFSTFARAFEFGGGALLAFLPAGVRMPAPVAAVASWLSLAALVVFAFWFSGATPFPGVAAVGVVIASVALLAAGRPAVAWGPGWLMERRPVQWIGDISYSIYLWHWPLIVMVPFAIDQALGWPAKLAIIAVTLVLAAASKRFIEDPVRRAPVLTGARPRRSLLLTVAAMAVVAGVAFAGIQGGRMVIQHEIGVAGDQGLTPSPLVAADDVERVQDCWSPETTDVVIRCEYGDAAGLDVALVGDSHAEALSGAIVALAEKQGWHLDTYLKQACSWGGGPMLKPGADFAANCTAYRSKLEKRLLDEGYDAIITTAAVYRVDPEHSAADFRTAWQPILDAGTPVFVIADNPHWDSDPVDCLVQHLTHPALCNESRSAGLPWPDPLVEAATGLDGVSVVDLTDLYCDDKTCYATRDGFTLFRDTDHLTKTYAHEIGPELGRRLAAAGFPEGRG